MVDYVYVSRLWTVGRTLDEVLHKHQVALRKVYPLQEEVSLLPTHPPTHPPTLGG